MVQYARRRKKIHDLNRIAFKPRFKLGLVLIMPFTKPPPLIFNLFLVVVCFATWSGKNQMSVYSFFGKSFIYEQKHVLSIIQFKFIQLLNLFCILRHDCLLQSLLILLTIIDFTRMVMVMVSRAVLSIMVFLVYITIKLFVCRRLLLFCHTMFPQIVFEDRIFITMVTLDLLCLFTLVFLNLLYTI